MTDRQREKTRAYSVSMIFQSAGEGYARETMSVTAADEFDAERIARDRALYSAYHDERVPDFGIEVVVASCEPPEPDDDPLAPATPSSARRNATLPG